MAETHLLIPIEKLREVIENHEDEKRKAFSEGNYNKFDHEYHASLALEQLFVWADKIDINNYKIIEEPIDNKIKIDLDQFVTRKDSFKKIC